VSQYVFGEHGDDAELQRLRLVEAWADQTTAESFRKTGVQRGWRCLEVGAGAGSIARWMSDAVGPAGAVVAADLNPRFLDHMPDNVEVRRHDLTRDELEVGAYDVAHSRLLLMHLPDPAAALKKIVAAVKSGGWLVAEEADWGLFALDGHPDAEWATALVHELFARHAAAGVRLPYFGRSLPGLVEGMGVDGVEAGGATNVVPAGSDATLYRLTFTALRHVSGTVGATEADLDRLDAVVSSPGVSITGVTIITVRGRKAADVGDIQ
jgi:SAM-dependent methyltransferase